MVRDGVEREGEMGPEGENKSSLQEELYLLGH